MAVGDLGGATLHLLEGSGSQDGHAHILEETSWCQVSGSICSVTCLKTPSWALSSNIKKFSYKNNVTESLENRKKKEKNCSLYIFPPELVLYAYFITWLLYFECLVLCLLLPVNLIPQCLPISWFSFSALLSYN